MKAKNSFIVELFESGISGWKKIKGNIMGLEREAFGDKAFPEEIFSRDFTAEDSIIVLLKEESSSEIVGFTYARSIEFENPERVAEKGETALIWDTVITKEHQGKHLVSKLMGVLEQELRKKGYKYVERDARVANNYAENIAKFYKDRIVKSESHDSQWGPQIFFRIKL